MRDPSEILSEDNLKDLKQTDFPKWVKPALAKLSHEYFSKEGWIYERKLDGERIITYKNNEKISLVTRNKKKVNRTYPEIVKAVKSIKIKKFIMDGEIVTFEGDKTSFEKLQERMHLSSKKEAKESEIEIFYYLFDLLYLDSFDLTELPLLKRKELLKEYFNFKDPLRYLVQKKEKGQEYYNKACKEGWEGIIAKKSEGGYPKGRSSSWLKFKCIKKQEFVIGGYTDPKGERIGLGALLLGYYNEEGLNYAGKVGTGFDDNTLKMLETRLKKLEQKKSPFLRYRGNSAEIHWVKPELVAEIQFTEWTDQNRLRHPSFKGLRRDKSPKMVIRESFI